ncbi:MAG: hypothetical protein BRD44_08225 [Bacteroidetes bacterium QS_7_67_15]|nr:MAG: hypothetical protein BRD44_08225 [Bacteroidetes bacterium QS_7_67_15]
MERLECKTCGAESMVPMNVMLDDDGGEDSPLPDDSFVGDYDDPEHFELMGGEQESRFYTCHVCGETAPAASRSSTRWAPSRN